MPPTVLLCTVGGSPEPIVKAIEARRPDHVVFIVTAKGGSDGRGSATQVTGPVPAPPALPPGRAPDLRTIPERAGLPAGAWELLEVEADDPDSAFWACRSKLREVLRRHPTATIWADYTGGTKSMTAALITATIDLGANVKLQVVSGERADLIKVVSGTERAQPIAIDVILAERALDQAAHLWSNFGYAEAALILEPRLGDLARAESVPEKFRKYLAMAVYASHALAAWDRLDHREALKLFQVHALDKRAKLGPWLQPLRTLVQLDKRQPLLLLDLWHNAQRRAARYQYDDAVARCYRLVEATAQYLLASKHGIHTDKVDLAKLPEASRSKWAEELGGKREAGLAKAWRLFIELNPEHAAAKKLSQRSQGKKPLEELDEWIKLRNGSLLAHGFEPLGRDGWDRVNFWMQRHWLSAVWPSLAADLDMPQLPTKLPAM
jgi:CRISPR-associated protein (TIGR02710 family)